MRKKLFEAFMNAAMFNFLVILYSSFHFNLPSSEIDSNSKEALIGRRECSSI